MAREIKFRGVNEFTGDFSFGFLTTDVYNHKRYIETAKGTTLYSESVKPATVGQFTGLKDKNGVDIYEDDLVITKYQSLAKIIWHEEFACFCYETIDDVVKGELQFNFKAEEIEVVGNIHQNPELLNQ